MPQHTAIPIEAAVSGAPSDRSSSPGRAATEPEGLCFPDHRFTHLPGAVLSRSFRKSGSPQKRIVPAPRILASGMVFAIIPALFAQTPAATPVQPADSGPIAIVPLDTSHPDRGAKVTGDLEVSEGKAIIASSGEITSGSETTAVTLPRIAERFAFAHPLPSSLLPIPLSQPAKFPGLMMAMDHGAVEASFATGRNADILLTPDFRILIGGPGAVEVKVRLGEHGDTCVDNPGADAPYVLVSSVLDGGAYRVQPGQRVMFQHGSLREVVDQEKEPCGCPAPQPIATAGNEFPLAQSEGLAPLPKLAQGVTPPATGTPAQPTPPLVYAAPGKDSDHAPQPRSEAQPPESATRQRHQQLRLRSRRRP